MVNPIAGGRNRLKKITEAVRRLLKTEEGVYEIRVTRDKAHARELSKRAVEMGFDSVVACGGDGTVNDVAAPLVNTGVALGIIPAGSGNGLAASLGIPFDIPEAVGLLKKHKIRDIDVGVVCGRYFFSTAGFGFDAELSKRYNEGKFSRKLRGILPYIPLAIFEFAKYRPEPVLVKIGANHIKTTPFILTVANTERYGAGAVIAPGACPDDGLLDVCIVPHPGIIKAPDAANKLLGGKIDEMEGYKCFRGDRIEIVRKEKTAIHVDGEPFEWGGDIKITTLYRKLKVLVA